MAKIPTTIVERMSHQRGDIHRGDQTAPLAELARLGIAPDSQFGAFYLRYRASSLHSDTSFEELMDVASPSAQIRDVTTFVRETYEVPEPFVCITSAEGEGFYLYDPRSEAVYDLDVTQLDALARGALPPRWPDFHAFLEWYLA